MAEGREYSLEDQQQNERDEEDPETGHGRCEIGCDDDVDGPFGVSEMIEQQKPGDGEKAERGGIREAGWLVYPLLLVTGLRMVVRDFLSGQTLGLVIALAAYGFALIVSTKMMKTRTGTPDQNPPE